jgi:hypothetical protein
MRATRSRAGALRSSNGGAHSGGAHSAKVQIEVLDLALELPREVVSDRNTEMVMRGDSAGARRFDSVGLRRTPRSGSWSALDLFQGVRESILSLLRKLGDQRVARTVRSATERIAEITQIERLDTTPWRRP